MAPEDIIVPAVVCNGIHLQVFAIIVLEAFFPVRVPVSRELDLRIYNEAVEAMAHLAKINEFVRKPLVPSRPNPVTVSEISYNQTLYFEKVLTKEVLDRGLNLFGSYWEGRDHMMEVFTALFEHEEARQHVVSPLAIRLPEAAPGSDHIIIFENLTNEKHGYAMGVPPFEHRDAFLELLEKIAGRFLEAGVVHGDLYPSNYMWRIENGQLEVKIIDWDTAHLLRERRFVDGYAEKLKRARHPTELADNHDMKYVNALRFLEEVDWDLFRFVKDGQETVKDAQGRMNNHFAGLIRT